MTEKNLMAPAQGASMTHGKPHAILITASDIPDVPPCCAAAHERGYRRGYRDGYTYALWDVARLVRLAATIWDAFAHWRTTHLLPWVHRGYQRPTRWKGGPRWRPTPAEIRASRKEGKAHV
jgi:hypothetical protein